MTDLRNFLTQLGLGDARSLLQSGNVVFTSKVRTSTELERYLESEAADRLSLEVDFFVRTPDEWKSIIRQNPFRKEAERDPGRLVVLFLKSAPSVEDIVALEAAIRGPETVRAKGKQAYIYFPDGQGRSKLTNARASSAPAENASVSALVPSGRERPAIFHGCPRILRST